MSDSLDVSEFAIDKSGYVGSYISSGIFKLLIIVLFELKTPIKYMGMT